MKTIKIALSTFLVCLTVNVASAQTDLSEKAAQQTEKMKVNLQLTDVQVVKVQDINYGILMKNEDIKNDTGISEEQKGEMIQENNIAKNNMLKDVLTEEQMNQYSSTSNSGKSQKSVGLMANPKKFNFPVEKKEEVKVSESGQ